MVKAADSRRRHNLRTRPRSYLNRATRWGLLVQSEVGSVLVIISQILTAQPLQVFLIQWDHVIQQLSATTAHPSLGYSVLPWTPDAGSDRPDSATPQKLENFGAELRIAVENDISIRAGQRKSLTQLLQNPFAGRMRAGVKVQNSAPAMFDHKEAIQNT